VARWIADGVGLHLDDSPAGAVDEQRSPDELGCDLVN
jgi:hypothetical protein